MSKLALVVNFLGIDKMSGAVRNITASTKASSASIKAMSKEAAGLNKDLAAVRREMRNASGNVTELVNRERALEHQLTQTNSALDQQKAALARTQAIGRFGDRMSDIGGKLTLGLTLPIGALGAASLAAARDDADALGQVRAALTSMGGVAGRTEAQLTAAAGGLSQGSLYEDDAILRDVTANLLTFGKVADGQFDRAQQAALDLATRFKGDLKGSTLAIGKALNDPVKGLTALSRMGVQFDASQKAMVKSMMATGDVAGAQKIILAELEKQVGGSAKAARDADPGGAFALSIDRLQGAIGGRLLPLLVPLTNKLTGLIDSFANLSPQTQSVVIGFLGFAAVIGPLMSAGGAVLKFGQSFATVGKLLMMNPIGLLVTGLAVAAYLVWRHWNSIKGAFNTALGWLGQAWSWLKSNAMRILEFAGPIGWAAKLIITHWDSIKGAFNSALGWLTGMWGKFTSAGSAIIDGLVAGIKSAPGRIWNALTGILGGAWSKAKEFLGIKSPSRLFATMGGHISSGLALGIDRGGAGAVRSMRRVAGGVAAAGAVALSPAIAQPSAPRTASAATSMAPNGDITINVYAAPGQDAESIAREVMAKLVQAKGRDDRGSFDDDV